MSASERTAGVRELVPLLFVENIVACASFYVDRLGFAMEAKWEPEGHLVWCRLAREGAAIMLQQAYEEDGPAAGRGHGVRFYFNCADVDAMHAEFAQRGLRVRPPEVTHYGEKQLSMYDPEGYHITFQSPVER